MLDKFIRTRCEVYESYYESPTIHDQDKLDKFYFLFSFRIEVSCDVINHRYTTINVRIAALVIAE